MAIQQWPTPPQPDVQSLALWARQIHDLLVPRVLSFPLGSASIADGSVTTAKIADSAVTTAKINNGAVTSEKLASALTLGTVTVNSPLTVDNTGAGGGGEGAEIQLEKPPSGSSLNGTHVIFDIQTNSVRFFESGSPNRGGVIDLTQCANGAGTNLLRQVGGLHFLTSGTVSNAAQHDIVLTPYTAYRGLLFKLTNFIPAADAILQMRVSTNGGSSYDAGASDYDWATTGNRSGGVGQDSGDTADDAIDLTGATVVDSTGAGATFDITLMNQTAALTPYVHGQGAIVQANIQVATINVAGRRLNAQDTDAVRFLFAGANIASGSWALYGFA